MSPDISRRWLPVLGAAILLAVMIAGCTGSPYAPAPTTTQATTATTAPTTTATTPAATAMTTVPTPQITATRLNQTNVAIAIRNFAFSIQLVTVSRGTTITWTNQDQTQHQIVSDPYGDYALGELFRSKPLEPGQSYSSTFNTTGSWVYHDNLHPAIWGKVIVK